MRKEIRKEQTSHDIGEGLKGCSPVLHKGAPQSFSPKEKQAEFQKFTDSQGAPVQDDKHSLTVGRNGPTLLADGYLLEKLAHFDRERIPERVVHAKGAGAFGEFTSYGTATPYTSAAFYRKKGRSPRCLPAFPP